MPAALLDSSIYVAALRNEDTMLRLEGMTADTILWLSAVVLEELYAGAGVRDREYVGQLEHGFRQAAKIIVPTMDDWIDGGQVLARLAAKYGYDKIGRSRMTNDALIAVSAARTGTCVITANEKDFRRLAEFCSFSWQLATL
jgi:predicted nucleic acid-binding protein